MMERWQLQDAKNRFSEVVEKALRSGPQVVTRRGVKTVIIMSLKEYLKLTKRKTNLVEFLRESPLKGIELDLERDKNLARDVDL